MSSGRSPDRRLLEIGILLVMVAWAANFIVVKDVVAVLPPVSFSFLRYGLAAIALLIVLARSAEGLQLPRPDTLKIMVLGGLGFGLYQILWPVGLLTISAGDSALLISTAPVITALIAAAIGTDTLDRRRLVGVLLSVVGAVIVIAAGVGIELGGPPIGYAITFAAACCWATYTAVGARVLRRHSPLVLTTWASVGGTMVLAPIGIGQLLAPGAVGQAQVDALPQIVFAVVYSGLIAAALANLVIFEGVRQLGPTRVIAAQSLVPAMAVVLAFLILGEPIRLGQVVGGAIIIAGVALTRRAVPRPTMTRAAA